MRSFRQLNRHEPIVTMMSRTMNWFVELVIRVFSRYLCVYTFVQDASPLVYSLTDYRLKQKRPDFYEHQQPTSIIHPCQPIATSSTTLNSTNSLSMDENTNENKRLTSKWLIIDEIHVDQ
jgi:hypothetical protein